MVGFYLDSVSIKNHSTTLYLVDSFNLDNKYEILISGGSVFTYAGSANTVTITDFDNPNIRTDIRIIGNSDTWTVTINDGGNFQCPSGNIVLGAGDVANFWIAADNDYIYIGGSDNN